MATATAPNVENPKKTLVQSQPPDPNQKPKTEGQTKSSTADAAAPSSNPQQTSSGGGEEKKAIPSTAATSEADGTVSGDDAPVTDIQKKIRRAERFGLPVQLSEEEKRNSRAERFGTVMGVHVSDASKKSELQKRKARAERFGLAQSTAPSDDEAKKKARLARFAPGSKTDPLEEDKRKARAIRFSQNQPASISETNGEGEIQTETAVVGKAVTGP